jgi:hypothetical protein
MASNAPLNWSMGTIKGAGQVIAGGGITFSGGFTRVLDGRTLTIPANVTTVMDSGPLYGYNGAVINNYGSFNVTGDTSFVGVSGATPIFNNNGTFTKSPTTGITYMYWAFNSPNGTTVNQQSGTLPCSAAAVRATTSRWRRGPASHSLAARTPFETPPR